MKHRSAQRRGMALVIALIAFLAASALLFTILLGMLRHHRQLRMGRLHMQADLLAQAGVDRAVAQLRASPSYRGETWQVPAAELDGTDTAEVTIRAEPIAGRPGDLRVEVQADYPSDTDLRARRLRETIVHLP